MVLVGRTHGIETYLGPEPMKRDEAGIQLGITAKQAAGKEISKETLPPERADYRVMLGELDSGQPDEVGVETGLVKRYYLDLKRRQLDDKRLYWINKFNTEFDSNPQGEWDYLKGELKLEEIDTQVEEAKNLLSELIDLLSKDDLAGMAQMRGQFNLFSGAGGRALGPEASQKLGDFIDQITKQRALSGDAKAAAGQAIRNIIEEGIARRREFAGLKGKWEELSESTKARARKIYIDFRWSQEDGTLQRNAELKVLTTHRAQDGAPAFVYPGRERHVFAAIKTWRFYNKQLKESADPVQQANLQAKMAEQEKEVERWTSKYNGYLEGQPNFGPVGAVQLSNMAWYECHDLYNNLRDDSTEEIVEDIADPELDSILTNWTVGQGTEQKKRFASEHEKEEFKAKIKKHKLSPVKKTFIYGSSTIDMISWETMWHKSEIQFHYGVAHNVWQRLQAMEPDEFIDNFALELKEQKEDLTAKFKNQIEEAKKGLTSALQDKEAASRKLTSATENTSTARESYAAIKTAVETGKLTPVTKGGQQQQISQDPLTLAGQRLEQVRNLELEAEAAEVEARNKVAEAQQKLGQLTTSLGELQTTLASQHPDQGPEERDKRIKKEQYYNLLAKLYDFLNQPTLTAQHLNFFEFFGPDEIDLIARLSNLSVYRDRQEHPKLVTKNIVEEAGGGDYVFIDVANIPELKGRVSPDIISQLMKNPKRFPQLTTLMERLKEENKIVIVLNGPIQHGSAGGVREREHWGAGRQFNEERAEELKKVYGWNDNDLFMHWLDDLSIQRELGIHPEEIEARYTNWLSKQHQLRRDFFSATDGWTFIHNSVPAGTSGYFESMTRRLKDAGYDLTSDGYRSSPFYKEPGKSNESTFIITDADMSRQVLWRDQDLAQNPETNAPETLVGRLYQSLRDELLLYRQRTLIAGQTYGAGVGMSEDDIQKLGAIVQANMNLIDDKIQALENIYYNLELSAEARLDAIQGFSRTGMKDLTYEIVDSQGRININARNKNLWKYYNATAQWGGKLARNLRELQWVYSQTITNPNASDEIIDKTRTAYLEALGDWRNFNMKQTLLGMQAAGQLNEMDSKEISKYISKKHAEMTFDQLRKLQENEMRAIFEYDNDFRPWYQNAFRRFSGKLFKNKVADFGRWIGHVFGVGDRFLREVDMNQLASIARNKFDDQWMRRLSAHMAYTVRTNYQNRWGIHPASSNILYPGSKGVAAIFGEDMYVPSSELSPTGELLFEVGTYRVADDIDDAMSRTLLINLTPIVNAGKRAGWDVDELMNQYLRSRMNNRQITEPQTTPGRGLRNPRIDQQYNFFGNRKKETFIDEFDEHLITLLEHRLGRPWFGPSPEDTRYTSYNRTNPPAGEQHQESLRQAAGVT